MKSLKQIRTVALLAGVLSSSLSLTAQRTDNTAGNKLHITSYEVAVMFHLEHEQVAQVNGNRFWMKGGSLEGAATFWKGIGIAANLTGEHASNIQNNVGLSKIAFMAGPHITVNTSRFTKSHPTSLFGEWLFGGVHAFDSTFPGTTTVASSAGGFSTQVGGGLDVALKHGLALRVPELDYIHTNLSNNGSNSQNGLRLAFGVSYRK